MPHTPKQVATVSKTVTLGRPSSTLIFLGKKGPLFVPENVKIPGIPLTNIVGPRQQHLDYVKILIFYETSAPLVLIIVILAPNQFLAKISFSVLIRITIRITIRIEAHTITKNLIRRSYQTNPVQIQFKSSLNPV